MEGIRNMKEYSQKMREEMQRRFEDLEISEIEVVKMNDQKLHGIMFKKKGVDTAPTFYIEDLIESESSFEEAADELARRYELTKDMEAPINSGEAVSRWEDVSDRIAFRLVGISRNVEYLKDIPHKIVADDLVLTCDIVINQEARAKVNRDMLKAWNITEEELFSAASKNAGKVCRPFLTEMSNMLFGPGGRNYLEEDTKPEGELYVLTDTNTAFGAACLFYDGIKEKICKNFGELYLLPSSVHEFILIPDSFAPSERELCEMVKSANEQVVSPCEILSDYVYHIDSNGMISRIRA